MSAEILVNVMPRETRAVLVENGIVQELYVERANRVGITSNIYKGRVSRVLPGMQAAFIDVGLERTAFLHVSDIASSHAEETEVAAERSADIREHVREGDEILVQVLKDPLGTKGARLTTFVSIPSRYLVYLPKGKGIGVSTRIEDESERGRLRDSVTGAVPGGTNGGYIVRTVAEGADSADLREDLLFLHRLWGMVHAKGLRAAAGELVHEDLPLPLRLLRDQLGSGIDHIAVDNSIVHSRMLEFARTFMPASAAKVELYGGARPIFDLHGIEDEIAKALERKVPLKSGGYVVIDQTEAMTTIDVNTGAYVGHRNLEETIYRTNLEAAVSIARQLRLRF